MDRPKQYPRLLIISHNLFDDSNNIGKTLISLLDGWPVDKLAQIYFRNEMPSFVKCKQYYRITDKDVAKSVVTLGIHKAGEELFETEQYAVSNAERDLYRFGNKRIPIVSFVRDAMWSIGTWKTNALRKWVNEYDPEAILFVPNDYVLAYQVAIYIEKHIKQVPLIPYYMDDSFYYDCKTRGIDFIRRLQIRNKAKQVHVYSYRVFTICEKMSRMYEYQFGIPCADFMNSIIPSDYSAKIINDNDIVFSYIGNLHSNRWRCLIDIGKVLDKVSESLDLLIELRIYSASDLGSKEMAALEAVSCIRFMGSIPPNEVQQRQRESDYLLHVEAFDNKSKNSTRYSLSTKIPEYLNVGVSILAYGPSDIASIEYLIDNNLAFVCCSKEQIEETVHSALSNNECRERYIINGLAIARKKHNIEIVSERFTNSLIECWKMGVNCE